MEGIFIATLNIFYSYKFTYIKTKHMVLISNTFMQKGFRKKSGWTFYQSRGVEVCHLFIMYKMICRYTHTKWCGTRSWCRMRKEKAHIILRIRIALSGPSQFGDITLRKHAYSNILKILLPKNWKFSDKNLRYFSYYCSKHILWVLVRTASPRRF